VIVTYGGAVLTLKQVTGSSIPIVFALAVDPLGVGLIASLSHPGGNVTGTSIQQAEIAGKRLDLLRQVLPNLRRLAIMFDGGYRAAVGEKDAVQSIARKLGLEAAPHEIRTAEEIPPYINALKGEADALYVVENALTSVNRVSTITFALNARLPTAFTTGDAARDGALMAYGPNLPALFRRAADYVDKILRGAKPGDLRVEQPTKFDLVINLRTAKALGIEVPNSMQVLFVRGPP
jgi:putative tryptophan/tyrosine transport system substrate-binding protein